MFFLQHAPRVASQARTLRAITREVVQNVGPILYDGIIEPRTEKRVVYGEMTRQILGLRGRTLEERSLMHLYAYSLVYGDRSRPIGLNKSDGSMVEQMLTPGHREYRAKHPLLSRIRAAA